MGEKRQATPKLLLYSAERTSVIAASPAQPIRRYLDQNGANTEVPFQDLLTSWELESPTAIDRQQIVADLSEQGIAVSRPLSDLEPDDLVTLSIKRPAGDTAELWPSGSAPPPAAFQATTISQPSPPPRRWVRVGLLALMLILLAGAGAGGFFYGQGTRLSDQAVEAKLTRQASHDKGVYTRQAQAALGRQKRQLSSEFTKRQKKAVTEAQQRGQQQGFSSGQQQGQQQGFQSGKAQGHEEGRIEGEMDGYSKGFDEGTCYDPDDYEYVC